MKIESKLNTVIRCLDLCRASLIATALVGLVSSAFAADIGTLRKSLGDRGLNVGVPSIAQRPALEAAANTNPQGGPYGVLGAGWWQWVFSLPVHDASNNVSHPLLTTGAVDCSIGQSGPVWFLAGNITGGATTRSCTVPHAVALFFPMLNSWCDNTGFDAPSKLTLPQLRSCAAFSADPLPGSLHASVDGIDIPVSASNRGLAEFEYTLPNTDNFLQFLGAQVPGPGWPFGNTPFGTDVAPAISDGNWALIGPLSQGAHTIKFGGTALNGGFSLDIIYSLTVN